MAQDPQHLTDTYKEGFCCVCGTSGVNQYYGVRESYIDYCGNFQTFTEMLNDLLNLGNISQPDGCETELCYDCKDKLVRFYHFKRKAHEVQGVLKNSSKKASRRAQNNHSEAETFKQEPKEEINSFQILSAVSLIGDEVAIKEEKEEFPDIVFTGYSSSDYSMPEENEQMPKQLPQPSHLQNRYNPWNRSKTDKPLSKAAMKMRLYRERLKLPENRDRFLQHQKQQREYNRRHYQRKQVMGETSKRKRSQYEENDEFDADLFITP